MSEALGLRIIKGLNYRTLATHTRHVHTRHTPLIPPEGTPFSQSSSTPTLHFSDSHPHRAGVPSVPADTQALAVYQGLTPGRLPLTSTPWLPSSLGHSEEEPTGFQPCGSPGAEGWDGAAFLQGIRILCSRRGAPGMPQTSHGIIRKWLFAVSVFSGN